jgi:hypothetical protein
MSDDVRAEGPDRDLTTFYREFHAERFLKQTETFRPGKPRSEVSGLIRPTCAGG